MEFLRAASRLAFLLTCCVLAGPLLAAPLRIGVYLETKDHIMAINKAILSKAYAELEQPVVFVEVPIARASSMLVHGQLDGNLFRGPEFGVEYPAMTRIATPLFMSEVRVYSAAVKTDPADWAELRDMRVAYVRGATVIEHNLPAGSRRADGGSEGELFRMLQAGMADVALIVEPAQSPPNPLALKAGIQRLEGVLDRKYLYHYLSAQHAALGQRLGAVLKRMQAAGEFEQIKKATLAQYE